MRLKLAIITVYGLACLAPGGLLASELISKDVPASGSQGKARLIKLDPTGSRGIVLFNHKDHETRVNPDPATPFKAKQGAACAGCHHTESKLGGVPQLWKCASCHKNDGNPDNPKSARDYDEMWSKPAFHNLCIGCHLASSKGPTKCGDCHGPRFSPSSK